MSKKFNAGQEDGRKDPGAIMGRSKKTGQTGLPLQESPPVRAMLRLSQRREAAEANLVRRLRENHPTPSHVNKAGD